MEPLPGISHGDALKLIVSLAALLGTARLLGEGARRFSLPPVIGEITAGVVLGPSFLAGLIPAVERWIVPATPVQSQLLDLVGLLGVLLMMVVVGMETDLGLIRARASTAVGVGLGGLLVPIIAGFGLGALMPADLRGTAEAWVFSLFVAIALALSAIPVLARVLMDLDLMRRDFGQVLLAAGMIDDILGWTLLGVATSLASAGTVDVASIGGTVGAVAFVVVATVLVVRPVVRRALMLVRDRFRSRDRLLTLVVVMALVWAAVTQALHLEALLGAFIVGIVFGQVRRLPIDVGRQLEAVTFGVFAPVFLATAGLRLDLRALVEPRLALLTVLVIAVATAGKVMGAYAGARLLAGRGHWEAIAYGAGLNARGVLGIIVASLGLSLDILSIEVYSMIVVMSVVTSLMAPAALRWALARAGGLEDVRRQTVASGIRWVLVPVRPRLGAIAALHAVEAAIIERIGDAAPPAVTLLTVSPRRKKTLAAEHLSSVGESFPRGVDLTRKVAVSDDPVPPILDEAANDYDLVVLGASEHADDSSPFLFSSVVDEIVRLAPCPTMVVRADEMPEPWPPDRILVPVDGSPASRRAVDIAFALAQYESEVVAFHVVAAEASTLVGTGRSASAAVRMERGREIVEDVRRAGVAVGCLVSTEVVGGVDTAGTILERARSGIGLVVLGTTVRAGSLRLYLGPSVERVVAEAACPVIVMNGG